MPPDDEIRAAGVVLCRAAKRGVQVLLVHRPKYDDWSLPKGKLEPGEHELVAAVREAAEETGYQVTLGRRLPPVRYLAAGTPKRVDYWVATAEGEPGEFVPNREIDGIAWVLADDCVGTRPSYERENETLAAFVTGPCRTTPLILLRHASAGTRSTGQSDDSSRPLDAEGDHDAAALAKLLRCFGVSRVVSAPAERCVATVRQYAAAVGGVVDVEPAFDIADHAAAQGPAGRAADAEKAAAALAAAGEPVIVCAHRENLSLLLAAVCAELGAEPPAGKPLRKGEFLVLHRAGGQLVAVERYRPPSG